MELGCLKPRSDNPSQAEGSEPLPDVDESFDLLATSDVSGAVTRDAAQGRSDLQEASDTASSNAPETRARGEAVLAWLLKQQIKLQKALEKLLGQLGTQPALIKKRWLTWATNNADSFSICSKISADRDSTPRKAVLQDGLRWVNDV